MVASADLGEPTFVQVVLRVRLIGAPTVMGGHEDDRPGRRLGSKQGHDDLAGVGVAALVSL